MSAAGSGAAVEVVTFGCRLNLSESQTIRARAAAAGLRGLVVVNTCAVTAEAERQAGQAIRRLRRERPGARIVVTGCAAEISRARYESMPEVDAVVANAAKLDLESYAPDGGAPAGEAADPAAAPSVFDGHSRAFIRAQTGCDRRCTFCVIPFGRGPSRSTPAGEIVREVRAAVEAGCREAVLTGVDLAAWGADLPGRPRLGALVRRLLALVPGLPRLRLSSLDPVEIDDDLVRLFAEEPRLMPHLHLSVQAGDDLVLKRMKRRHLRDDVLALAERLRRARPDIVLGADLIAGFPTETEAMAANTRRLVEEAGLVWLHVFPYSPRPGTPAARMPQVPQAEVRARAAALRAAGKAREAAFLRAQVGRRLSVLVENDGTGRSEHFAPVRPDRALPPRRIVELVAAGIADGALLATVQAGAMDARDAA